MLDGRNIYPTYYENINLFALIFRSDVFVPESGYANTYSIALILESVCVRNSALSK